MSICLAHVTSFGAEIQLSVGLSVAPYVIMAETPDEKDSGFEIDIVREALNDRGYTVTFIHQPLKRTKISFKKRLVDGVLTIKNDYPEIEEAFLSDEYITYLNVAVSLTSRNLKIDSIADLENKKIVSFQQSRIALGKDFDLMAAKNPDYWESANQKSQVRMLFLKRVDVIVLDRRIFQYIRKQLKNVKTEQAVTFHPLFAPSSFRVAFRDKTMSEAFNLGLKDLKATGRYDEIINTYVKE